MIRTQWWKVLIALALTSTSGIFVGRHYSAVDPAEMPACMTEAGPASDGTLPCFWNARTHGNGIGDSFVRFDFDKVFIIRTGRVEEEW